MFYHQSEINIDSIIYDEQKMDQRMKMIADRIRTEREKKEMSLSNLAEKANLSVSCVSKAESARSSLSLKTILKIAAALQIPVSVLLESEEDLDVSKGTTDMLINMAEQMMKLVKKNKK